MSEQTGKQLSKEEKDARFEAELLPVLDPLSGRLLGLLTLENIGEMMMVRAALGQQR